MKTKIVLYRNGRAGVIAGLPGRDPMEEELTVLLGGQTEMLPIDSRLVLVTLDDGERLRLRLPLRYRFQRDGMPGLPISGDCAVVAVDEEGAYIAITTNDYFRATRTVVPVRTA